MYINSYAEFEKLISNGISSGIFIICGQERKLIDRSIQAICSRLEILPEINITKLEDENITFDIVSNACETLPFISDYKIVHLDNPSFLTKQQKDSEDEQKSKKPRAGSDLQNYLIEFAERKPYGIILLITIYGDMDEKNKLIGTVKKGGYLIQYNPLKGEELNKWVRHYFEKYGKEINRTEILYLISAAGTSTEQLDKEIEKLCSYTKDKSVITKEDIDDIVHKNLESNIFKMVDCISKKDANGAVLMLDNLLSQKEKHLSILGMITRQYRLMLLSHEYQNQKMPPELIGEKIKLKGYPLQNMLKQSRNYDVKSLSSGLKKCLDTDYKIKKGIFSGDELDLSLELLIVELCK